MRTIQRSDGSAAGKAHYLGKLPDVTSLNGKKFTPRPAPRLSVFVQTPAGWQIIAHANFNPLTG